MINAYSRMIPTALRNALSHGPRIGPRSQNLLTSKTSEPEETIASQIRPFQVRPFRLVAGGRSIMLKESHDPSLFTFRIQAFSTTQAHANSADNFDDSTQKDSNKGETIYQQALEALQQVSRLQEEREKEKSQELHRAIEKAEAKEKEHAANPKAKTLRGVTVVKTVVKQTRKELGRISQLEEEESNWNEKAHNLLKEAAVTYGHPESLILLGNGALQQANAQWVDLNDVQAARQSVQMALEYYETAGKNGSAEGWFNLGQLLWTGYPAKEDGEEPLTLDAVVTAPDRDSSLTAFRKSIELGDPDAMYFVGVQLLSQEPSPTNEYSSQQQREGHQLIESSASLGHGLALYYLALLHLNGNEALGISPCSPEAFVEYLDAACSAGNADALFLRGHSGHEGENGYPVDYAMALQDFLAASRSGHADAAVSAGAMLHQGRPGVPRNQSQAFALYQTAGELGSREGWRNVVACYALGEGVPRSEATARYIAKTMLQEDETEHACK
jgi:TPR repeat protein